MEAELDAGAAPDADEGSGLNSPFSAAATVKNMRSKHKCEDTLLSICRSYGISTELYKPVCAKDGWGPCRTPPEASNALCVFEAMLEAGVRFPLHELYNKVLTYFNLAPSQLVPNEWRQLAGFVLVCEDVGITPMAAVFRYYFKLVPVGNGWYNFKVNWSCLFKADGGIHVNTRWKERWFFLDSLMADNPWRCPQEWGTPRKGANETLQLTQTAWNAIDKLNAVKEEKGISLMKLIIDKSQYNHNFPVLPPLHEQVKSETEASDEDDVTPSTHPPKRPCLPTTATAITITAPNQRVIGTTSSAPPGFTPVMSPRSTVAGNDELSRPQIQDAFTELRLAKENLASEQAARAKALEDLEAEQSKTRQLTGQLQVVQAERDKALMQLKEMGAELTVRCAAQAQHTARVRQLEAEHATKVSHLTQLLRTEEGMHMAKVQRLESDLETVQAEVAKALGQLKEMRAELTKAQAEDTDRVCQLRNAFEAVQAEGAKALGQLKETRAELTKTQAEHTYRVCQLRNAFEAAKAKHVTKVNRLVEERKEVEANLQQLAEELEAEKAKHAAEVNAVRAQCYSQIKAAAIKYINELMPEPLPVMENSKKLKKPKAWKHTQPITPAQLKQMRDGFWDTAPHYGGQKEIWDALRVAAYSDLALAETIVDSAGIIISNPDMTVCYDESGAKYELPKYVLSEPTNLIRDG